MYKNRRWHLNKVYSQQDVMATMSNNNNNHNNVITVQLVWIPHQQGIGGVATSIMFATTNKKQKKVCKWYL